MSDVCHCYLDWAQSGNAFSPSSFLLSRSNGGGVELKRVLGEFSEDAFDRRRKALPVSVPRVAETLIGRWVGQGTIGVGMDRRGLIAIVLSSKADLSSKEGADPWSVEERDNLAVIIAFLVRSVLGDVMTPVCQDGLTDVGDDELVIGALYLEPLPVVPGAPSRFRRVLDKNRPNQLMKLFQKQKLSVRPEPIAGMWPNSTDPLIALAGRPVVKRDHLLALTSKIEREWLARTHSPALQAGLSLMIAACGGIFFGAQFADTIRQTVGAAPGPPANPVGFGLGAAALVAWLVAWLGWKNVQARDWRSGIPSDLTTFLACFLLSMSAAVVIPWLLFGTDKFSRSDSILLAACLGTLTALTYFAFARREADVRRKVNEERLNGGVDSREIPNDKWPRFWSVTAPIILLICSLYLSYNRAIPRDLFGKPTETGIHFGKIWAGAAWAMPAICFGALVRIWVNLGAGESLTLLHSIIQRRMQQIEAVIIQQKPLLQAARSGDAANAMVFDIDHAAKLLQRSRETIREYQEAARSSVLSRAAVLGAAGLALLQFAPFKNLEPQTYAADQAGDLVKALHSVLSENNDKEEEETSSAIRRNLNLLKENIGKVQVVVSAKNRNDPNNIILDFDSDVVDETNKFVDIIMSRIIHNVNESKIDITAGLEKESVKKAIEELLRKTTDGGDSLFVSEIKGAIRGAIEDSFGKNTDRSLSMVVKEIEDAIARAIERGLKRPNGSKPAPGEPASKDLVAIVREALTAWETAGCSGDAVPCFQRGSPPPTCNPTFASFYFALNVWNAIERMKLYRSGGEECYLASAGANSRRCSDDGNDTPEDIIKLKLYDEISKPPTENSNIHIIGFADNRGFVDKNIILAERRSEYIEGLMNRAFSSTRNKMISYGKGQEYQLQVRPNRVVGESSDSRRVDVKWCDYNP